MKILKQTSTNLVTQYHQTGERLASVCCLLISVGAVLLASTVPEISCQRNGTLTQCKLIRHMLGNWQLEQPIVLQGARSQRICGFSRGRSPSCSHNESVAIVQTQSGEIQFIDRSYPTRVVTAKVQNFIKDSNQTSLQIRSASWSMNHPISNGFLLMLAMVMFISACNRLINEKTYKCNFDKTKDWVNITQQQMFMCRITEFPISSIKSITLDRIGTNDCIILTLQSGQWVCVAQAFWVIKRREYRPSVGFVRINKNLEKDMETIASFLRA